MTPLVRFAPAMGQSKTRFDDPGYSRRPGLADSMLRGRNESWNSSMMCFHGIVRVKALSILLFERPPARGDPINVKCEDSTSHGEIFGPWKKTRDGLDAP